MNLTVILLLDARWAEAHTIRFRSTRMFCGRNSCKARRTLADLREHGMVCITFGCIFGAIFNEVVRMCAHQKPHDVAVQTETAYLLFLRATFCATFLTVSLCVAKVSRALCSHEVGTRVGGFLRPLANLRNLRCRGS